MRIVIVVLAFIATGSAHANWIEHSYTDEMTDAKKVGAYSNNRSNMRIGIQCVSRDSAGGDILFEFGMDKTFATPSEAISMKVRVDKENPFDLQGKMFSNSYRAGFTYLKKLDPKKQKELLTQLISGNGYVIRYSRLGETLTERGNLRNSKSHILKVLHGCKYEHFEAVTEQLGLSYSEYLEEEKARKVKAKVEHAEEARQLEKGKPRYIRSIQQKVKRRWINPQAGSGNVSCVVRVRQVPSGEVIDVNVVSCIGGGAEIERSVERAVLKASPLPSPSDPRLFERVLEFPFEP